MKRILAATALSSVAVLSSCSEQQGPQETAPRRVAVVTATEQPLIQGGTITGDIRARVQSDLSFRVSGKIIERLVDVGAAVKAGQILARIDAEEQRADLEVAVANLEAAEAQQTQAQLAFDRQQNLFRTQVTTRAALDQAQEALLTAQGSAKSAQAQLETARDALSFTELRADADGVITARNAEVGQVAQAAQVVFTLAHDGPRDAVFEVVETLFLGREVEPSVTVKLLSDLSRQIDAKVREVSPTIDPSTGTIKVKLSLNGNTSMPLGAPVAGSFRYKPLSMIQLPWSAMASKGGMPAVWVVDPRSAKTALRAIEIEGYQTNNFTIKAGVSAGDIVVSDGTKFLRPNEIVSYDGGAVK
ncbi:efflux RND transporter periplasmic adaptor subunit [Rhizobium sullae]|uniref:Efflux RND transporter periplasmic adaptor subunit n=1 Tax=Rhizobium sullae TaxID=50338 RepID=A0A4R3PR95_RHISU|nr:efflux RND transporter periplasmic adaptor subunit [Rhizobium sullae]TCU06081.1 RND family efflux transporter MFP subunit [Rhizobium sullae]UWU19187.1 efflux RND transporter periplasmic adaptor subunit [Rhizobium sullae]